MVVVGGGAASQGVNVPENNLYKVFSSAALLS